MRISRFLLNIKKTPATQCTTNQVRRIGDRVHNVLFHKYLLTTNTVSSGILMFIGDIMAQEIEYQQGMLKQRYDWWRVGRMFIVGAIQGPMHHYFYCWLDRVYRGSSGGFVTKKILYDQLVMSPACIVAFFYSAGWLEGRTTQDCTDELQKKVVRVYLTDWAVWPAAQFLNFYYLHPKYRVVYVNFVTMLYNVFLSYIKHDASKVYIEPNVPTELQPIEIDERVSPNLYTNKGSV